MRPENQPPVDPAICTIEDLKEIIASDPQAHPDYQRELDRRLEKEREIARWEFIMHEYDG